MSVMDLIPKNIAPKHIQGMKFDKESNKHVDIAHSTYESIGLSKQNIEFPIEVSTAIWKSGGKNFYCEITRNITERKKTQERLIIANKELESFIYKASHDLKGPLSSSLGLVNIARLESKGETESKYFDHIEHSLRKLENILDDLRQVAIIKQGVLEFVELDVMESIKDIIPTFKYYKEFDSINFEFNSNSDEPIITDRSLLELYLRNTIENAIKYQKYDYDKSFIHFDLNRTKDSIQITIKDNGIGIDAEHVHTIFDMFVRANTSSKGTGLGLYIAKNAIDKLRGTIHVESKKGKGTTFKISLPLEEKPKEEEEQ
jgi:signal transduction histidine kinase